MDSPIAKPIPKFPTIQRLLAIVGQMVQQAIPLTWKTTLLIEQELYLLCLDFWKGEGKENVSISKKKLTLAFFDW